MTCTGSDSSVGVGIDLTQCFGWVPSSIDSGCLLSLQAAFIEERASEERGSNEQEGEVKTTGNGEGGTQHQTS